MSEAKAKRDNGEDSAESEEGERHALDDRKWNKAFREARLKNWQANGLRNTNVQLARGQVD